MLPWFPGDFMTATRGWSVTARGVYRELLDAQWDMGALPSDPDELRGLINATPTEWGLGWKKCELKFPVGEDGQRRNGRLEMHRIKAEQLTALRSEVGRRGGQASAQAKAKQRSSKGASKPSSKGEANSQAKVNHPSPSPSPSPSPEPKPSPNLTEGEGRSASRAPPTQLGIEFELTPDRREYAEALGLDAKRVFELFVNHFVAADGPKSFSRNWDARWRKWCLEDSNKPGTPRKAKPGEAPSWLTAEEREEFNLARETARAN